jgi:hypothetical protein
MTKFTRNFEDDYTIESWIYDLSKFNKGPIEVNIKYKKNYDKDWIKRQNAAKQMSKIERKLKKQKT